MVHIFIYLNNNNKLCGLYNIFILGLSLDITHQKYKLNSAPLSLIESQGLSMDNSGTEGRRQRGRRQSFAIIRSGGYFMSSRLIFLVKPARIRSFVLFFKPEMVN